ncbi:MAG: hypothetical protein CMB80_11945 [Flammeovirgaceae bacterium]|nr:hypothetical protein [Flammeovirgaceae bacterium]MBE61388.1 hypothetical protein [Flammeovirgaceae bacterium]HCX21019.1 hypothetical protein [Cytophagales bacterium]|tara:strand:+ start:4434 stop:5342 length:909 start_codon:yes stop_codon:yes gene_type:complete
MSNNELEQEMIAKSSNQEETIDKDSTLAGDDKTSSNKSKSVIQEITEYLSSDSPKDLKSTGIGIERLLFSILWCWDVIEHIQDTDNKTGRDGYIIYEILSGITYLLLGQAEISFFTPPGAVSTKAGELEANILFELLEPNQESERAELVKQLKEMSDNQTQHGVSSDLSKLALASTVQAKDFFEKDTKPVTSNAVRSILGLLIGGITETIINYKLPTQAQLELDRTTAFEEAYKRLLKKKTQDGDEKNNEDTNKGQLKSTLVQAENTLATNRSNSDEVPYGSNKIANSMNEDAAPSDSTEDL